MHLLQQRNIQNDDVVGGGELVLSLHHGHPDGRVGDGVEVGERLRVTKDDCGHGRTIDVSVAVEDAGPETIDHGLVGGATGGDHIPRDQVSVDHDRPVGYQQATHIRFSRSYAPGQPYSQHSGWPFSRHVGNARPWRRGPWWSCTTGW